MVSDFWTASIRRASGETFSARIEKLTLSSLRLSSERSIPSGEPVAVTCFGVTIDATVDEAEPEDDAVLVSFEPSDEVRERIAERLRARHPVRGRIPDTTTDVDEIPPTEALRALTSPSGLGTYRTPRPSTVCDRPPADEPATDPTGNRPIEDFDDELTEDLTPEQTAALHAAFEQDARLLEFNKLDSTEPDEDFVEFGQDTIVSDDSDDMRP